MAQKGSGKGNITGVLAFVSLLLSAICMLILLINNSGLITIGGTIPSLLNTISYICLVVVVILCGWSYASTLSKTWRIIFIIIAVLAILGVLGIFKL